jgi:hypothetical protein
MVPHLVLLVPAAATLAVAATRWCQFPGNIKDSLLQSDAFTPPLHLFPAGLAQPVAAQRILPSGLYSIRLEQGRAACEFKGKL